MARIGPQQRASHPRLPSAGPRESRSARGRSKPEGDGFDKARPAPALAVLEARDERAAAPAIQLAGVPIERLASPPAPANALGRQTMRLVFDLLMSEKMVLLGGEKSAAEGDAVPFWRRADSAAAALTQPLPPGTRRRPPLGKCAILRPGIGNLSPSPALVFRAARMADKVVVAYTNTTEPESRVLREATEIGGIPVPPELKGKILEIGSPTYEMVSYVQASDIFLEQLELMREQQEVLGFDPLQGEATVIAHSQGGLESVLSRKRLEAAGFPKAIGALVTVDSPFGGSASAEKVLGALLTAVGYAGDPADSVSAVRELSPEGTARWFSKDDQRWVDLAVAGAIGGKPRIRPRLGFPPFSLEDPDNIRPLMRMAATMVHGSSLFATPAEFLRRLGTPVEDDGLVSVASASFGRETMKMTRPYDHMGIWEDFRVLDDVAAHLAAKREAIPGRRTA